jgi:hypothetical protein
MTCIADMPRLSLHIGQQEVPFRHCFDPLVTKKICGHFFGPLKNSGDIVTFQKTGASSNPASPKDKSTPLFQTPTRHMSSDRDRLEHCCARSFQGMPNRRIAMPNISLQIN